MVWHGAVLRPFSPCYLTICSFLYVCVVPRVAVIMSKAHILVRAFGEQMCTFLLGTHIPRTELLGHKGCACSAFADILNSFAHWLYRLPKTLTVNLLKSSLSPPPSGSFYFLSLCVPPLLSLPPSMGCNLTTISIPGKSQEKK